MSYLYPIPHTLFTVVLISQSIPLSPFRLCTLEGYTVTSTEELESGQSYVAVGTERFKKLPYVEILLNKATGNSADRWCWWIIGIDSNVGTDSKLFKILGSRFFLRKLILLSFIIVLLNSLFIKELKKCISFHKGLKHHNRFQHR